MIQVSSSRGSQATPVATAMSQFERNNNGHIVLTIVGLDLTGMQEIRRLTANGFTVSKWARSCLRHDNYDQDHRLVFGQFFKIALMPIQEITRNSERTIDALRRRGIDEYGYGLPRAGFMPRIRKAISNERMRNMGLDYIVAPHDPITVRGDGPSMFTLNCHWSVRQYLAACHARPDQRCGGKGAFAFPVPAS